MSNIKDIQPTEVEKMMQENKDVTFIDVREDEEVAQGMVPNAKHIPLGNIPEAVNDLDKDQTYVMICRSGGRSMKAASYMEEQGFKNLYNMDGGMLAWDGETE
ncbi:rhodanese-like domain-containing protein [Thalassobacillus hwangdonensis]|uniref:Rhodanese-like domain-containing protein n=1 Tax=Thalassobacillus hwangdonensis TaxID=546108 RepID=A0ABW3L3J2_9BACI